MAAQGLKLLNIPNNGSERAFRQHFLLRSQKVRLASPHLTQIFLISA
jgi:hypothetical protein